MRIEYEIQAFEGLLASYKRVLITIEVNKSQQKQTYPA